MKQDFLAGVVEGFYGQPWSQTQRLDLFPRMQAWGLNTYFYAPKDDLHHRAMWREPYPQQTLAQIQQLTEACQQHQLRFIYGLSPGLDIQFSNSVDRQHIRTRFQQLLEFGVTDFALLFDDLPGDIKGDDLSQFAHVADAHASVTNEIWQWLQQQASDASLLFCPTPYCDRMDSWQLGGDAYLDQIGAALDAGVEFLWTGPEIISETIPVPSLESLCARIRRQPIIWDNLHANDYDMQRLYCGPYQGRSPEMLDHTRGILVNPNNEYWINYVPLQTMAAYVQQPSGYEPQSAYRQAVDQWSEQYGALHGALSADDLRLLTDCYYLPHELGAEGREIRLTLGELVHGSPTTDVWQQQFEQFKAWHTRIEHIFETLTQLTNRELFYAWSRRVWDLKEEFDLFGDYLRRVRDAASAQTSSTETVTLIPSETHLPGTYRGGLVGELRRQLHARRDGKFMPGPLQADIRNYRPADEAETYYICMKTGDNGDDGWPFYKDDPDALGRIYTAPYLEHAPELALVLEDQLGVCGYAMAVLDSRAFFDFYESQWRPSLCELFPAPDKPESEWSRLEEVYHLYHNPDYFCPEPYDQYPAHLHIDLLPRAQGQGHGRRMIEELLVRLRKAGSPGVHLGLSEVNDRAYGFYQAIGFQELARDGDAIYMGQRLN